jgi:hypothetical protein
VNLLRIGAEATYRSLETLIERTPSIQDAFDIDGSPDYSTGIAGISGRAAIDSTFFERHQASSHSSPGQTTRLAS